MIDYHGPLFNITQYAAIGFAHETLEIEAHRLDEASHRPPDAFGSSVWWYWHTLDLPIAAVDFIGHYVRTLTSPTRSFPVMLERVLAGLHQALPPGVENEEYEQISARARELSEARA